MSKDFTDIHHRSIPYSFLGSLFLKLEMKSMGWKSYGTDDEDVYDGAETTISGSGDYYTANTRQKWRHVKRLEFRRPIAYQKNILFSLVEALIRINQGIRAWCWNLLLAVIILGGIATAAGNPIVFMIYGGVVMGSWACTVVLSILARILRTVFRLDEKTDEVLESYGMLAWSEYEEF